VSSRQIVPADVTLRVTPAAGALPLGVGFVDLHVEWPPGRFAGPSAVPGVLYAAMLAFVLGAALLAGYLLLRDVHRETETAAVHSHFVASVSHELKTPLTSIRAHAETLLLGRAASAETTADYLKTIVSESERLTRLVDSVLDFSRIEQDRKAYYLQETPLEEATSTSGARWLEAMLAFSEPRQIERDGLRVDVERARVEGVVHAQFARGAPSDLDAAATVKRPRRRQPFGERTQ